MLSSAERKPPGEPSAQPPATKGTKGKGTKGTGTFTPFAAGRNAGVSAIISTGCVDNRRTPPPPGLDRNCFRISKSSSTNRVMVPVPFGALWACPLWASLFRRSGPRTRSSDSNIVDFPTLLSPIRTNVVRQKQLSLLNTSEISDTELPYLHYTMLLCSLGPANTSRTLLRPGSRFCLDSTFGPRGHVVVLSELRRHSTGRCAAAPASSAIASASSGQS